MVNRYFLVLFLAIAFAPALCQAYGSSSNDVDFESIKKLIEQNYANESGEIPESIKKLYGNERINLNVNDTVVGVVTKDGKIIEIIEGEVLKPTVNITLEKEAAEKIINSDDPAAGLKEELENGKIEVKGIGIINWLKYSISNALLSLGRLVGF